MPKKSLRDLHIEDEESSKKEWEAASSSIALCFSYMCLVDGTLESINISFFGFILMYIIYWVAINVYSFVFNLKGIWHFLISITLWVWFFYWLTYKGDAVMAISSMLLYGFFTVKPGLWSNARYRLRKLANEKI